MLAEAAFVANDLEATRRSVETARDDLQARESRYTEQATHHANARQAMDARLTSLNRTLRTGRGEAKEAELQLSVTKAMHTQHTERATSVAAQLKEAKEARAKTDAEIARVKADLDRIRSEAGAMGVRVQQQQEELNKRRQLKKEWQDKVDELQRKMKKDIDEHEMAVMKVKMQMEVEHSFETCGGCIVPDFCRACSGQTARNHRFACGDEQ
jgi:chromosome segregation ATPase